MKTVVILQARNTSTRLPGKVLLEVNGRTILGWVVRVCKMIDGVNEVCVATPDGDEHLAVREEAHRLGATVVTGSEHDVLARFLVAARATKADRIIRITTDCPLADAEVAASVLRAMIDASADYACNNEPFTFPHGLDCEAFTYDALELAHSNATDPYDREHVTPWLKRATSLKKVYVEGPGGEIVKWRWTIDTPEDFEFFEAVAKFFDHAPKWQEVRSILEKHPELHEINRAARQR